MRDIAAAVFILALVLALGIGALYYQGTVNENQRRYEHCIDGARGRATDGRPSSYAYELCRERH